MKEKSNDDLRVRRERWAAVLMVIGVPTVATAVLPLVGVGLLLWLR